MEEIVVETQSSKHQQEPQIEEEIPASANFEVSQIDASAMRKSNQSRESA